VSQNETVKKKDRTGTGHQELAQRGVRFARGGAFVERIVVRFVVVVIVVVRTLAAIADALELVHVAHKLKELEASCARLVGATQLGERLRVEYAKLRDDKRHKVVQCDAGAARVAQVPLRLEVDDLVEPKQQMLFINKK
jgi:uncharacterized protein YoxC